MNVVCWKLCHNESVLNLDWRSHVTLTINSVDIFLNSSTASNSILLASGILFQFLEFIKQSFYKIRNVYVENFQLIISLWQWKYSIVKTFNVCCDLDLWSQDAKTCRYVSSMVNYICIKYECFMLNTNQYSVSQQVWR